MVELDYQIHILASTFGSVWNVLEYFGSRTRPHLIQIQWGTEVVGQVERIRQRWPCNYLWTAASY